MNIVVTGSAGFIAGYLIKELLDHGHSVVGLDNFSKYGRLEKSYDGHPSYEFVEGDATDVELMTRLVADADILVAGAAMIGGITYFHRYAYDLLATNERITAAAFDAAIAAHQGSKSRFQKIVVMSSSMVFECTDQYPSAETAVRTSFPPESTYGFQKLATEYFAQGAYQQYGLPYTIVRPFNCVGIGEQRALGGEAVMSGNIELAMSHVVPDLVQKVLKGQDPLHILGDGSQVRHYTYGGDLARGIRLCIEGGEETLCEDFNLSTAQSTTVLELAELIWRKIRGAEDHFRYVSDEPFEHDVQRRIPDTTKARKVLGFQATTSLDEMLDEVIPWVSQQISHGNI